MLFTKIGIGLLAGTLTFGTGGAVAAHQFGVPGTGADRQARCETFQQRFAQNLGITTQQLTDTRKQTALQLIDEAATAGTITPEQAQRAKDRVNASQGACERIGDRAATRAQVGKVELQAVAQKLGITERELVRELRGGKSLAQVAGEHNVSRDQLKAKMHDAFKAELDKAVAASKLTQAQADAALARFDANLDRLIDRVGKGRKGR
jgi:hypothetical protein